MLASTLRREVIFFDPILILSLEYSYIYMIESATVRIQWRVPIL